MRLLFIIPTENVLQVDEDDLQDKRSEEMMWPNNVKEGFFRIFRLF